MTDTADADTEEEARSDADAGGPDDRAETEEPEAGGSEAEEPEASEPEAEEPEASEPEAEEPEASEPEAEEPEASESDVGGADADGSDVGEPEAGGAVVGGPETDAAEDDTGAESDEDGPDELIARVAAVDEEAAAEVESLRRRARDLEAELDERERALEERRETIDELESKVTRSRADFQNYKKRAKQREEDLRERATEDLIERLLDVRDNLVRALEQDDDVEVRDGVEATLSTFDRVLDAENVSAIEPETGGDVDPERHEVVHRVESGQPEGAIVEVYRPGYEMAGTVLRAAQVTVSEGTSTSETE